LGYCHQPSALGYIPRRNKLHWNTVTYNQSLLGGNLAFSVIGLNGKIFEFREFADTGAGEEA